MGKMDKVGAIGKSGRPSHSHAADRAGIPERNVGEDFACPGLLRLGHPLKKAVLRPYF